MKLKGISVLVLGLSCLSAPAALADWDGDDGDPVGAHLDNHEDYEHSEDFDDEDFAAVLLGGSKAWICSIVGPFPEGGSYDTIPNTDVLEDQAQYRFSQGAQPDTLVASVRDLSVVDILESLWNLQLPKPKKRTASCKRTEGRVSCEGPSSIVQYVRHFDDPVGLVYLLIENTHAESTLGGHELPRSKSAPDRYLGSLYHCLPRPI